MPTTEAPEVPYPSGSEMDRAFAAHLRQDPSFQQAVGFDLTQLQDEDLFVLHHIVTWPPRRKEEE